MHGEKVLKYGPSPLKYGPSPWLAFNPEKRIQEPLPALVTAVTLCTR
jgi:hypothetical protein